MLHRSERQNLKNIRKGRRKAYEAVVRQNYMAIYRFMAYLTTDVRQAEDLTQETFLAAWANIDKFKGRASLGTWLHNIAYNKFIDSKRKCQRRTVLLNKLKQHHSGVPETLDPVNQVITDESSRLLYEALRQLESCDYVLILLHYIQGLSFRQMAEVLDKPAGTIKWQISRALKKLRAFLVGRV